MAGDIEDLQWCQDRVKRLERQLAEAQADKVSLADVVNTCLREIHINQQASLSDDLRPFVEQLLFHGNQMQRERDALKATLEQAEKALAALFFAVGKMGANFPPHPLRAEWEQGRIVLEKMWKDKRDRVGVLDAGKEAGG